MRWSILISVLPLALAAQAHARSVGTEIVHAESEINDNNTALMALDSADPSEPSYDEEALSRARERLVERNRALRQEIEIQSLRGGLNPYADDDLVRFERPREPTF